jgi:hypothetical protein
LSKRLRGKNGYFDKFLKNVKPSETTLNTATMPNNINNPVDIMTSELPEFFDTRPNETDSPIAKNLAGCQSPQNLPQTSVSLTAVGEFITLWEHRAFGVFMKKFTALIFTIVLTVGAAFADHPRGWGVGLQGEWTGGWDGGAVSPGGLVTLKIPSIPIFWSIFLGFSSDHFRISLNADYYVIDTVLIPNAKLNFFFGIGGYLGFLNYSERFFDKKYNATSCCIAGRFPVGLSWQPLTFLELYADFAPIIGVAINSEGTYRNPHDGREIVWHEGGIFFPDGGWGFEFGVRFWF